MRFLHAIAFLALLSIPLASSPSLSPEKSRQLDLFVFGHLSGGETFSAGETPILVSGKDYYYIKLSTGKELFAIQSPSSKYGFELVSDAAEAKSALSELYKSQGYNLSSFSEVPKLKEYLSSFSESREPGESKCKQYIGTDMYPCYDRESCYKSCFTPLCNPLALGGGWPFVDLIVSFENSTSNMGNLVGKGELAIGRLESAKTKDGLESVSSVFSELNKEATSVKTNGLFTSYQLCYPINYDLASLVRAKRLLEKMESESLPLLELDSRAGAFAKEAKERGAKFSPQKIEEKISEGKPQIANAIVAENISEKNKTENKSAANATIQDDAKPASISYSRIPILSDFLGWISSLFK